VIPKRKLPREDGYEVPWRVFRGADGFEESFPRNERTYAEGLFPLGRNFVVVESSRLSAGFGREVFTRAVLTLSTLTTKGVAAVMLQYESRQ